MSLEECCELFNISSINNIDEKLLKKNYYKLCLLYHPDKNRAGEKKFIKMKKCYEKLNNFIKKNEEKRKRTISYKSKQEHKIYSESESSIDKLDKIKLIFFYIEQCHHILNNPFEIVYLDVKFEQVINRSLYSRTDGHHIPLWHKVICYFSDLDNKYFVFVIRILDLPFNVRISKNNDIFIEIPHNSFKLDTIKRVNICDSIYYDFFVNEKCIKERGISILNKGIPRINTENIYDTSKLSTIRIFWR